MPCVDRRPIPGFDGYLAGTDGSIWSQRRRDETCLAGTVTMYGYQQYTLQRRGREVFRLGHILVLEAFVGPRPEGYHACHANGNKLDNRLENLRWDTPRGNAADRDTHGTVVCGERQHRAKLKESDVAEMRKLRDEGLNYREIGNLFGVKSSTARAAIVGYSWRCVGDLAPPKRKAWAAGVSVKCSNPACGWKAKRMAKAAPESTFGECIHCGGEMRCGAGVAAAVKQAIEANMLTADGVAVQIGSKVWGVNKYPGSMFIKEREVAVYDDPDSVGLTYSSRAAAVLGLKQWIETFTIGLEAELAALAAQE